MEKIGKLTNICKKYHCLGSSIVEICNFKMNELYITAKKNSSLPNNIAESQCTVFLKLSDLQNINLVYPVFPKPWISIVISSVCMEYNLKLPCS